MIPPNDQCTADSFPMTRRQDMGAELLRAGVAGEWKSVQVSKPEKELEL